jgi:hypothetical protein
MSFISLSACASIDEEKDEPLFCSQKSFDEAMEVVIKMLDRLDRFDRVFAQE